MTHVLGIACRLCKMRVTLPGQHRVTRWGRSTDDRLIVDGGRASSIQIDDLVALRLP